MLEREVNGFARGLHAGKALDSIYQSRIEDDIGAICGWSTYALHGDWLYTHLMCINIKVLSAGTQYLLSASGRLAHRERDVHQLRAAHDP